MLFADLVGFTAAAEARDAEEVRELLSLYFDTARQLIERYGGTVEKFIGDAVMAVWGAPVAQEDDAERAVRAALDLVGEVAALSEEAGGDLKLRAGVLTGEAAVTLGASGQGMVAGDLVNTASRIQSIAAPGTVLVGEATKRASEAAIAYEEAGSHALKGKAEPLPLWRALRVTGAVGGALTFRGLEPPFVGRDRELRLVKELFHASADERKAHLVSVVGVAGTGKSRLAWEFEKYVDGIEEDAWWHRGRCLAYGEGVTYWALAEMVRMRAEIVEGEQAESARGKLRTAVELHVRDADERSWVTPRLAHLLGLEEHASHEREDLFAAWRLFLERMAETDPVVLVFDDMQWADASLLDFVEYLLEWSRSHPIFVLALARTELAERRPSWAAGKRGFTPLYLEALSEASMDELLRGLVPGLPRELQGQILARAEGVPLYAVETVRMLLDRGLLERVGDAYRLTGTVETLDVPQTLHALIAARLDGLTPEERRLVQDASVLGKTFTKDGLASVSGLSEQELEHLLASLLRKEVFSLEADPRSPERGQYGFVQDLLKLIAYETLAKRERKGRHLAAAAYLEQSTYELEEVIEVVAAHYLEAYGAEPDAADAGDIKSKARERLVRAGDRAASLAASEEAQRYFDAAGELADEPLERAALLERAGRMAWSAGHADAATSRLEEAITLFTEEGEMHAAARVSARLGEITWADGHIDQAVERMEASFSVLARDEPDEDLAALAAQLGRLLFFMGQPDRAAERIERALEIAETLWLPEVLSQALNTKSLVLGYSRGRPEEGFALLKHALRIAVENDAPSAALRAYFNLSNVLYYRDRHHDEALEYASEGLSLARKLGDRTWEWQLLAQCVGVLVVTGRWDDALEQAGPIVHLADTPASRFAAIELLLTLPHVYVARGEVDAARRVLTSFSALGESADVQDRTAYEAARATVLRAEGRAADALSAGIAAFEARSVLGASHANVKLGFVQAVEAALELGDLERAETLLAAIDALGAGDVTPYIRAQTARFRARLRAARGLPGVEPGYKAATALFREIGMPFALAVASLDYGAWLTAEGRAREAEPLLAEAQEIFERLQARPWLERAAQVRLTGREPEAVPGRS